jgi:hypothetical protein
MRKWKQQKSIRSKKFNEVIHKALGCIEIQMTEQVDEIMNRKFTFSKFFPRFVILEPSWCMNPL